MIGTIEGFVAAMLKHIREERHRVIEKLAHNGISDFNEYKSAMGMIQCLDSIEARIVQLIETHGEIDVY